MQHIAFHTIDEFLTFLPDEELIMVEKLRSLIYQVVPEVQEKLSYNVPFFRRHASLCFIWPPSIPWGRKTYPFVRLGFSKGYLLEDEVGYLEKGDRKQVYYKDFTSIDQLDEHLIITYLTKAVILDENLAASKK